MQDILFLDIEVDKKGKVVDYGALFGSRELHDKSSFKLQEWIKEAKYICGHNIISHDIPILEKLFGEDFFEGKRIIDTLLWSPLLFPQNPYHKLVKGYQLVNEKDVNNPLSDSILAKKLFVDLVNKFNELESNSKNVFYTLLGSNENFNAFFEVAGHKEKLLVDLKTNSLIEVCLESNLEDYKRDSSVELAYVIALLSASSDSILPKWVEKQYPRTKEIVSNLRFNNCNKTSCSYCSTKLNPQKALDEWFGYSDFRKFDENRVISLQEETVRAGLTNESFVAVFPTGGGKSLTFQLPALMLGECVRSLTVVISPLMSLMKDQVDNLQDRFSVTKAVAINGLLSPLERQDAINRVENGSANLLYISPESLRSPTIYRLLSSRNIARFVIDEAHCFSSWGQDFRVDYLFIGDFIKNLIEKQNRRAFPVSCFTATAKPQVINDIKQYFKDKLDLDLSEFITRKGRNNLSYEVIDVPYSEGKMQKLLSILNDCEYPAIIYASRTKTVEKVANLLSEAGFPSNHFHGQLDKDAKKKQMDSFMNGDRQIIVATSAFGMGVDKEDVRTVIHYNISDSLENYIQEAGRAGRNDKIDAKCYILFHESDLEKHFSLLNQTKININEIKQIWRGLKYQSKFRKKVSSSALEIAKEAGWDTEIRDLETKVATAVSTLEQEGFLKRNLNTPQVFADSLLVSSYSKGATLINNSDAITDKEKEDCSRVLKRIVTDKESRLDYIVDLTGLPIRRVQQAINTLRDLDILGDAKDLTAYLNLVEKSKNYAGRTLKNVMNQELALMKVLDGRERIKISLRQLNQNLIESGLQGSKVDLILKLLNYWEIKKFISKKRVNRENQIYEIRFKNADGLRKNLQEREALSAGVLDVIIDYALKQNKKGFSTETPVGFSLQDLKKGNTLFGAVVEKSVKKYEDLLLFLNHMGVIKLQGGFMVSYNRFNIENIRSKEKVHFTNKDYEKMNKHYDHKVQQIHIVGEYAKRCIQNYNSALRFVDDYFQLDYAVFLKKHFPNRSIQKSLRRPITSARFKKIAKELDTDQFKILSDNKSKSTLVLAGPGSGKTKVLVHKIANLLLLEDVKPEQFLMLTFSKSAALEFRYRVNKLIPEYAGLIKMTTFHGYCFELLGQLGDLKKSVDVIKDCVNAISTEEIDITQVKNKSVLVLDEFQDISKSEWDLIKAIIEKSEGLRVIAVGDDDQNIYSFRGSSNEFMKEYGEKYDSTRYELVKNYRSKEHIVNYNNSILSFISGRLKEIPLVSARKDKGGSVSLVKYSNKYLHTPIANAVKLHKGVGSKAVLVRTNEDALLLNSLLKERGIKSRLIAGIEGFKVSMLLEIRQFSDLLANRTVESGVIPQLEWEQCFNEFKERYSKSHHYSVCMELINNFNKNYKEQKLLIDWREYVREVNIEDAIHPDNESVIVSTMHKAKGKEFDNVWIHLENYDFNGNESKRLLYVALSRAKNNIEIHTNNSFLDGLKESLQAFKENNESREEPEYYDVQLGLKDVNLSNQIYPTIQSRILNFETGDKLYFGKKQFKTNEAPGLKDSYGNFVTIFSREFCSKTFDRLCDKGYEVTVSRISFIVFWFNPEDEKEYRIILPKLRFRKVIE